jgi:predicted nucleic acid-binding protein
MSYVLDASITMAWFFKDERRDETEALFHRTITDTVYVPVGWAGEVINTIMIGERRSRCTSNEGRDFIDRLQQLSILVDDSVDAFGQLPDLCRQFTLTAYDAAYLALAIHLKLPLATDDTSLQNAARASGVPLLIGK